jgi:hypothetical protein
VGSACCSSAFRDDPVRLRERRHLGRQAALPVSVGCPEDRRIALVVSDQHHIHHVRERGYVKPPVRVPSILRELDKVNIFRKVPPLELAERHVLTVHDEGYYAYFKRVCAALPPGKSL